MLHGLGFSAINGHEPTSSKLNNSSQHSSLDTKVNSVQKAYAKCFTAHILEFEILQKMKQRTSDPQFSVFHQYI